MKLEYVALDHCQITDLPLIGTQPQGEVMSFPTRRTFLQCTVATIASFFLPRGLRAGERTRSFWFIHAETGEAWGVDDPVSWCLENARQPILERARERLLTLDSPDPQRVVRLVTRRCKLNLIELHPGQVEVHYWGQQGKGDLRPFFKKHRLARKGVEVVLIERKREISTVQSGDDFLFGERPLWPWKAYWTKWQRRHMKETDDWAAAPHTWSGFVWNGRKPNRIPWAALKSAWRRTPPMLCMNCDEPTILANFGFVWRGMFNRFPRFIHICRKCRRSFEDDSVRDLGTWMVTNLDAEVLPDHDMVWGRTGHHEMRNAHPSSQLPDDY